MPRRILSHSTLERKIRLIFGLMILLIIIAAFFFPWYQMEPLVREQDELSAAEMTRSAWHLLHAGATSPEMRSKLEELSRVGPPSARPDAEKPYVIPYRGPDEATGTVPSAEERGGAAVVIGPPRNGREQRWLEEFAENPDAGPKMRREPGKHGYEFVYAYPHRARAKCLECHQRPPGQPALAEGDLIGMTIITFPVEETRKIIKLNRIILVITALVTAVLSMVLFYGAVRLVIVQPVKKLKAAADRVTEGDLDVRADLQTGDEFEALSESFNRMLERLEAAREELRRTNVSLDRKLEELARANVSLFEMNQVKSKFLTTMSHELRTPLNAIIGFADLLESNDSVSTDAKTARYVQNIRSSGHLLLDIINDLLDLAKIEAGKMELKLERVSPLDVCETAMNMVRPLVGRKALRLEMDVADGCPIMTTDANKLQQILYNLLSNAVKFTPTGFVRLTARPLDARTMFFQVLDSGPGLSPEQQRIIFDRFSQVDQGHTRAYGGTGLGLSIVHELVELLGGDVTVQSESGEGAAFNVTLPVVTQPAPEPVEEARVTKVEAMPQPKVGDEMAPEPVTPEDTVLAADVEADALQPEESATPGETDDDSPTATAPTRPADDAS